MKYVIAISVTLVVLHTSSPQYSIFTLGYHWHVCCQMFFYGSFKCTHVLDLNELTVRFLHGPLICWIINAAFQGNNIRGFGGRKKKSYVSKYCRVNYQVDWFSWSHQDRELKGNLPKRNRSCRVWAIGKTGCCCWLFNGPFFIRNPLVALISPCLVCGEAPATDSIRVSTSCEE